MTEVGSAVRLSIEIALWCVVLGVAPALGLGWVLARRKFRGKSIVSMVVLAPLVLPPVVTGLVLLDLLGRAGTFGGALAAIGVEVPFTFAAAVIAAFVVGLPLYVMAARSAIEAVDPRYEEVSWTLGVTPWRTFWRVALPLALPGVAAGAVLVFARALGEFGATVVLAGNVEGETRTIALAVYHLLDAPRGGSATRILAATSLALSFAALVGYELLVRWQRRRLELHDAYER